MPRVTVLPHPDLCPQGRVIESAPTGENLCRILLDNKVPIEHACELSCACTTCHVIVREGFASLAPASDNEEDMLDKAWGLSAHSRLACQARLGTVDVVVEIPKYTINHASENH